MEPAPDSKTVVPSIARPDTSSFAEDSRRLVTPHVQAIAEELLADDPDADVDVVWRALNFASHAHAGQTRKSGDPYLIHPVRVASTIARMGLGPASVASALMHDAVEDSDLSVYELTEAFGREVANLVDGVTKLGKIPYLSRRENQAESFRKMLVAMSRDIRVLLVKLADRLDNMRTLEHMPPAKRERIARETIDIYAPLARRLGIDWIRNELQDLAFVHLEPVASAEVRLRMDGLLESDPDAIDRGLEQLRGLFAAGRTGPRWSSEIHGLVELRATMRSAHKIHKIEENRHAQVEMVSDLVSYQIITETREGCYAAFGHVHGAFQPVPGRFRDYVALPRPNRYQALHTTVVDRSGVRMDVQIRSQSMDAIAERGVVEDLRAGREADVRKLAWVDAMMDWQDEIQDPNEFIESVKAELFADEVYVFTPQGDLRTFQKGATPIDFAFAIHTDVGMSCAGARVNGQVVPLRYELRQGDTVEILTSETAQPRPEWLKMARTTRARAKIKHVLRQRERDRLAATGRSLVVQALRSRGVERDEETLDGRPLEDQLERFGVAKERGVDGIFEDVGVGRVEAEDVAVRLEPGEDPSLLYRVWQRVSGRRVKPGRLRADEGGEGAPILLDRERLTASDSMIELGRCCSPVPGDPVVGLLVPGRGIIAHVEGCPEALDEVDHRRVYLAWSEGTEMDSDVEIEVKTANEVGLLGEMSRAFSRQGVDIKRANCRAVEGGKRAVNTFWATVRSRRQLDSIVADLKRTRGVISVERILAPTGR